MGCRAQPRACAARSPGASSGHLDDHLSATCSSRSLLAPESCRWFSPPTSGLPPPSTAGSAGPSRGRPLTRGSHGHEPVGATSASGEYCVSRCGEGAGGGGRREAAPWRLCAPHCRTRGREGRCRPAAAPGPRACPASRLRTPRPSAPRLRHRPGTYRSCLRPLGPGGRFAAPATSARPALLGYPPFPPSRCSSPPRRNAAVAAGLAASQRRAPHLHVTLTWTRIPPSPPACPSPAPAPT